MTSPSPFALAVAALLARHDGTGLAERWEESGGAEQPEPVAYWLRDSDELVNVAWLTLRDVRDITLTTGAGEASFISMPFRLVSSVYSRQKENLGVEEGPGVKGDHIVSIYAGSALSIMWSADTVDEQNRLRHFVRTLVDRVAEA